MKNTRSRNSIAAALIGALALVSTAATVQNTWAIEPMTKMIGKFYSGLPKAPLIAPGTPDPYTPPAK